eukprot:16452386-Heterocapsa_arctica.AAC.2
MFNTLDQSCSWSAQWYQILSSRRPLPDFIPADVEVAGLGVPAEEVWNCRKQVRARGARRQVLEHEPPDPDQGLEWPGPDAAAAEEPGPNAAIVDGDVNSSSYNDDDYQSIDSNEIDEAYGGLSDDIDGSSSQPSEDELETAESEADDASEKSQSDGDTDRDEPAPPGAPEFGASEVWHEAAPPSVPDPLPHPPEVPPPQVQGPVAGSGSAGAAEVQAGRVRARAADARVCLPNGSQISFYESTGSFEATCSKHTEAGGGFRCRLTRTSLPPKNPSRKGQGRPLGFLASWCCLPHNLPISAADHKDPFILLEAKGLPSRQAARNSLKRCQGYEALTAFERATGAGEESEPEDVP